MALGIQEILVIAKGTFTFCFINDTPPAPLLEKKEKIYKMKTSEINSKQHVNTGLIFLLKTCTFISELNIVK